VEAGITTICLLMDDIPVKLPDSCKKSFKSLGAAHGELLTSLRSDLNTDGNHVDLWFCPSVYTDQFIKDDDESPLYLINLAAAMPRDTMILWTGPRIVPPSITTASLRIVTKLFGSNICIWDNLYANDYCPHKLFIGPYTNRQVTLYNAVRGMMLNPTGMVHTDIFLLTLLADQARGIPARTAWQQRLGKFPVAREIQTIVPFFDVPHSIPTEKQLTPARIKKYKITLKKLIWDWKSPLHREWYPYLFMLDSDLSLMERGTDTTWITKKYPPVLASFLNQHNI
jgi:hypothetical protein